MKLTALVASVAFLAACGAPPANEPVDPVVTPVATEPEPETQVQETPIQNQERAKATSCDLTNPASASGTQMVESGIRLAYDYNVFPDGTVLVYCSAVTQDGQRASMKFFNDAVAAKNGFCRLYADVDNPSRGVWTFNVYRGDGPLRAQANYNDSTSDWNGSGWWMTCETN